MKTSIKLLLGAITTVATSLALAQGNPPTTSSPNPATGAGQQTQQNTPMGTTGTPAQNPGAAASTAPSGSTSAQSMPPPEPMRTARADRN